MADTQDLKQVMLDAILDADSLEKFINGSDSETVLTRLSAKYPTLQKAIKTMFENGGLPAMPFDSFSNMQQSALADGKYAMVTNDGSANGLYVKTGGSWSKQSFNLADMLDISSLPNNKIGASLSRLISSSNSPSTTSNPPSPYSFFGNRLISYYDYSSILLSDTGAWTHTNPKYRIGSGKYPLISLPSSASVYTSNPKPTELSVALYTPVATSELSGMSVFFDERVASELSNSKSFTFFYTGIPMMSAGFGDVFFELDNIRLVSGFHADPAKAPNVVSLQQKIGGKWLNVLTWSVFVADFKPTNGFVHKNSVVVAGARQYGVLVLEISENPEQSSLYVNFEKRKPIYVGKSVQIEPSVALRQFFTRWADNSTGYITQAISSAFLLDAPAESCRVIRDYLSRDAFAVKDYYRSGLVLPALARSRIYPTVAPTPTTLSGGYSVIKAADVPNDFTIKTEKILGNIPKFNVPSSPNVAPWNEPHDRMQIDSSVLRLSVMPHPDYPSDTQKLVMMANSISYPSGKNPDLHMCAYESTDAGNNFTRKAVSNPGASLPSYTTSTVNNIVIPNKYGRYMYLGDTHPNGYKPETSTKAYKYFYLDEWDQVLYGCGDLFDFSTYEKIKMNKQSNYHPQDLTKISGQWKGHTEGQEGNPIGLEEKIIDYDPTTGKFFRIAKLQTPCIDSDYTGNSNFLSYMSRSLVISWSEKHDITRWGAFEPFVIGRRKHYQSYDLEVVKYAPDVWLALVYRYTDWDDTQPNTEGKYKSQHEKMSVDLYVSHDQFKSPPVLIREDWISNTEQEWASGTLWAAKHPNKNKLYINAGSGLHGGYRPNDNYYDYAAKVAIVDLPWMPSNTAIIPDKTKVSGKVVSRLMDGSRVDKFRIIASGLFKARIVDANGVAIPNMDFEDFHLLDGKSGLALWNGIPKPPNQMIRVEVIGMEYDFSGVYPMKEHNFKFR